jgi:hypothetical protein
VGRFALEATLGVLTLRLLPIVGFAVISRKTKWPVRIALPVAYAFIASAAAGPRSTPFQWLLLAYAYFTAAAWAAFQFSTPSRGRVAWFAIVLILFWICPLVAIDPIPTTFLVVGWEFLLAAYSYHADTARVPNRTFGEFLFFLLVNPALVYRNRGVAFGAPAFRPVGVARVALGIIAVFSSFVVIAVAPAILLDSSRALPEPRPYAELTGGFLRLVREYAAHSGVASLQIGALLLLGHRIPERYRYPLFARNPAEFWRRWNTYVGDWGRTYVYTPLLLAWMRSRRTRSGPRTSLSSQWPVVAACVVITFAVIGALHDLSFNSAERRLAFKATLWFVAVGCAVVVWEAMATRSGLRTAGRRFAKEAERVLFLAVAGYAASLLW